MSPRKGLNVPIVTALDETGKIIEADQRRIIRHTFQNGNGADSIFICGTTGEFNRLTNEQRQQLFEIGIDETRRINAALPKESLPFEVWVGVTAPTKIETLENIELVRKLKADMAVIAPLTIGDLEPNKIVDFFEKDIAELTGTDALPISLYDNPDIAAAPEVMANLPIELVEKLRLLPFIVCLKASTTREVLQNYLNAFSGSGKNLPLDIYFGNAPLIFEINEMQREAGMNGHHVAGVVSGTANLFPREWQQAWQAVIKQNLELAGAYRSAFADFEQLTFSENGQYVTSKLIAGIKQGLYVQGIITSPQVARGTPALTVDEAEHLNAGLAKVFDKLRRAAATAPQSVSLKASLNGHKEIKF